MTRDSVRFWLALGEAQRHQLKNEERLEQSLGKLKGDFLLARAVSGEENNVTTTHLPLCITNLNLP